MMKANWQKFRQFSWREKYLFFQALFLLPLSVLAVRVFGFRRWQSVLVRLVNHGQKSVESLTEYQLTKARSTARVINAAANHGLYQANCLPRSITLWWLLQRYGIAGEIRIGVRKEEKLLQAHAWVECRGIVINDQPNVGIIFTAFDKRFDLTDERDSWNFSS